MVTPFGPSLDERARAPPIRLGPGPVLPPYRSFRGAPVLEAFFSALLILVCVGVLAFTVVAVKKLYQGQR
ncbi:hypothetical protein GCM10010498_62080 [Streptomyces cavourensis]|nr:hypothetical protein GCM10010498_62080 [Streptomyces cavourensis]